MKKQDTRTMLKIFTLAVLMFNIIVFTSVMYNGITGGAIIELEEPTVFIHEGDEFSSSSANVIEIGEPAAGVEEIKEVEKVEEEFGTQEIMIESPTVVYEETVKTQEGYDIKALEVSNLSCIVTERTNCAGTIILGMYNLTNAHAEYANISNYTYGICCNSTANVTINTTDTGNNQSFEILHISNVTNAHVELANESNYSNSIYISVSDGNVSCTYADTCPTDYTCLATVSSGWSNGTTNMHIADCVTRPYNTSICCSLTIDTEVAGVNTAPTASITSPANESRHSNTTSITVTGTGTDAQDGALSGDSLVWYSDIDGNFGNGTSVTVNLTKANHTITLNATDSGNLSDVDQIYIYVVYDLDFDGVNDDIDTLEFNESSVSTTGVTLLDISVDENTNIDGNIYTDEHDMKFEDSGALMFNFTHNFTENDIDLRKVSIEKTSNSIVVNMSGQLAPGETKTLFLPDNSFIELCASDNDISLQASISSDCSGSGEYNFTLCLGNDTGYSAGPLTCYDTGSIIRIENFTYSGVVGTPAAVPTPTPTPAPSGGGGGAKRQCEDGIDNDGDGLIDMDDPGCEAYYDDDEFNVCVEDWDCTRWSECADGISVRRCVDENECSTDVDKPIERKECVMPVVEEEVVEEIVEEPVEEVVEKPVVEMPAVVEKPGLLEKILEFLADNGCIVLAIIWALAGALILLTLVRAVKDRDRTIYLIKKNEKAVTIFLVLMGLAILISIFRCVRITYIIVLDVVFLAIIIYMLSRKADDIRTLIFDFNRAYRAKDIDKCREIYKKVYIRYTLLTLNERRRYYPIVEELRKRVIEMRK